MSKVGFIGLGIMGSRMAANLQARGYKLVVFNRSRDKAEPLLRGGARWGKTPVGVADQADILVTMLANPEAVEAVALGPDGFLRSMRPGSVWINSSTVNPSFSRKMAAEAQVRGIRFLGAPVTGSKDQAAQAKAQADARFAEVKTGARPEELEAWGKHITDVVLSFVTSRG